MEIIKLFQYVGLNNRDNENIKRMQPGWMIVKFKNVLWLKHYNNTIFLDRFSGQIFWILLALFSHTKKKNYKLQLWLQSLPIKSMFYYFRRISQVETLRNQAMHRRKGRTARHWSQDIAGRNEEGKTLDMLEAIFWSWEYFTREQSKTDHWLDSSGWIMAIRKTRFNLLGVIYKGKWTRLFKCTGLFFNSDCLVYKIIKP